MGTTPGASALLDIVDKDNARATLGSAGMLHQDPPTSKKIRAAIKAMGSSATANGAKGTIEEAFNGPTPPLLVNPRSPRLRLTASVSEWLMLFGGGSEPASVATAQMRRAADP